MIVLPIVVSSLTVGIAKMGDIRKLGRVGLKTLIYFEILSTIAIVLGMIAGNVFEPGTHVNVHNLQATNISSYLSTAKSASSGGIWSTVMDVVPTNFFASLADSKMLQVIVFSVFFGLGTAAIGQKGQIIIDVLDAVAEVMFKVTNWVMQLAPIGVGAYWCYGCSDGIKLIKVIRIFHICGLPHNDNFHDCRSRRGIKNLQC